MGDLAFDGAVLCGGASRRMGRDKATIEIDGVPMFRRVADALAAAGAASTTVVGGLDLPDALLQIADRWPGEGPLGGIVTALGAPGATPVVAVASCDLVHPDAGVIAALVAARAEADADVAVAVADGRDQWTVAVWHRRRAPALAAAFTAGERAIHRAVGGTDVVRVPVAAQALRDADRPVDLPPSALLPHDLR